MRWVGSIRDGGRVSRCLVGDIRRSGCLVWWVVMAAGAGIAKCLDIPMNRTRGFAGVEMMYRWERGRVRRW
jgi:hypothetical protein